MGLPALKHGTSAAHSKRPRLTVVRARPARKAPRRTNAARLQAIRNSFRAFAVLTLVVATLGVGRVWLSVKAAEASMDASRLRTDIKNERYEGDMLEVQQSALGSPSRIQAIAGAAMDMAPAGEVTYLDLTPTREVAKARKPVETRSGRSGLERVVAGMMDLTAGEAQVLLVGDIGLVSSR